MSYVLLFVYILYKTRLGCSYDMFYSYVFLCFFFYLSRPYSAYMYGYSYLILNYLKL